MDPLSLIGGIASIGSSIIGAIFGGDQRSAAQTALNDALQNIKDTGAPPDQASQIILQHFKQVGLYSPQLEQAINLGVSQVSQIQEDPSLRQAQETALQQLGQRAQGGLTASDRAAYNQLRGAAATAAQGASQQALQNARASGFGSQYGNQLAQQLEAAQQGAQTLSAQGDQISGQASQNALAALGQYGTQANQLRSQDFNNALAKAQAADQFSVFNTQNQIARQQQNVAMQNQAQQQNLANQQNISNQNVGIGNQQLAAQLAAQQQLWQSKMAQAQAENEPLYAQAGLQYKNAGATGQQFQNIGQGLSGILNTIAKSNAASKANTKNPDDEDQTGSDTGSTLS